MQNTVPKIDPTIKSFGLSRHHMTITVSSSSQGCDKITINNFAHGTTLNWNTIAFATQRGK